LSKEEFQSMSFRTGIIATIIVFSTLSILAVYDFQMSNTVEKTEMEVFEDDMEGMLEKMQKECDEFGSPGNFESKEMQLAWNGCMSEANTWLENNFP